MPSFSLALLQALAPSALAASQADEAERDQIIEEMNVLAARQQWKGVEQQYARLEALERRGVEPGADAHMLGVEAARTAGDTDAVVHRLGRAIQSGHPTAGEQRRDVLARYGRVRLELGARPPGDWKLEQVPAPFAPDARAAIERADAILHDRKRFEGFLPAGTYRIGERSFQVDAGPSETLIAMAGSGAAAKKAAKKKAPKDEAAPAAAETEATTGLHARVGAGFGGATAPTEGVVAPPSGTGLTPVLGAGLAWRSGDLQVSGLLVGRALFASGGDGGQQLYLGTAELLVGWDLGALRIEAGPLYGVGAGRTTGVAASADPSVCASGACDAELARGTVLGGGAEAGISVPLFDTGSGTGGLDLHAGAIGDGTRVAPWVTVALGISPGSRP